MPAATTTTAGPATEPLGPAVRDRYLDLVGDGDEFGAVDLVLTLLEGGVPAERIMLGLIAPVQTRVGELWAANTWSVAREHGATAVSERAIAALGARVPVQPSRGRVTVACTDGEWHALPVRILAEVLRLRGWRVDFLGANVPGPHLVTHLHQTGPEAVALSCALPTRLPRAHATLTACQAVGVPVIAGGRGFGADGRHALRLGADAWAGTADAAADRLAAGWPPPVRDPHDSPHVADDEYTTLARRRAELIAETLQALGPAFPPMAGYDQRQHDATAEDLAHIFDFLAAALYVDDASIFTDFVRWTTDVLAARGVPDSALIVGLSLYRSQLRDFPRARQLLGQGVTAVRGHHDTTEHTI